MKEWGEMYSFLTLIDEPGEMGGKYVSKKVKVDWNTIRRNAKASHAKLEN